MDKFRIKIWDASGVVYDNMLDAPVDMDSANPQTLFVSTQYPYSSSLSHITNVQSIR